MSRSMPRIGVIMHRGRDALYSALISSLAQRGYVDGGTIALEPRFAEGLLERTTDLAADLVTREVDLIIAIGFVGALAARRATEKIPIVYAVVVDPVGAGLAASTDRPGGNMAGVTNYDADLAQQQLSILNEAVPNLSRIAILSDRDIPRPGGSNALERSTETAARALGLEPHWIRVHGPAPGLMEAFNEMVASGAQALNVLEVPVMIANFQSVAILAIEHRLPTMFPGGWQHDGLMAYGTSLLQTMPDVVDVVGLILAGTRPADVPVRQTRQHRLEVNLETARRIGLHVPSEIVARAHKVMSVAS